MPDRQPGRGATGREQADDLREECERLRRQLLRYGAHTAECKSRGARGRCECGWSEVRAALAGDSSAPSD